MNIKFLQDAIKHLRGIPVQIEWTVYTEHQVFELTQVNLDPDDEGLVITGLNKNGLAVTIAIEHIVAIRHVPEKA